MESAENFSIDHFEEKVVSYVPVLERANQEDASGSETVRNEEAEEEASQKATAEMESDANITEEVVSQSEANILTNEVVGSEAVAKEKVEIVMGVKQTIEVELVPKEAVQERNAKDMNPESPQKSELNLFNGSKQTDSDQSLNVDQNVTSGVESDLSTQEVGRPADKGQILNVSVGIKQTEEDMEYPSPVFKSEVERPCNPIDIEAKQVAELGSKFQASTTIFVKDVPEVADLIKKEQSTVSGSAVVQSHLIEVERKFQVTNFDESKLLQANGKLISEESFEDVYFDNNSYDLILSDCWLRKRNQKWEFKVPVNRNPSLLYMSTQFHELEDEKDISVALREIIKPAAESSENSGIVEEFKLNPFATFTTTRKSYKLPSDCTVVIDFTSFGYSVGEIELMVKDKSGIGKAIERIDAIAGQLGFQMLAITELAKC